MTDAVLNTDRELYRVPDVGGNGDYYLDRIHVTQGGSIGINVGGLVIVKPLSEWHELAQDLWAEKELVQARIDKLTEALTRQSDNMAFVLNHTDTGNLYEKFLRELEQDRAALKGPE